MPIKKILYVRGAPYQLELNSYNIQEIGLASAFSDKGIECDIVFYHKKKNKHQVVEHNGNAINIFWENGIRFLRTGIYPKILSKKFLSQYDAVIVSEYSQIMVLLLRLLHPNIYIYNGLYYNLFKIPVIEKIYDRLFSNAINKNVKHIFCKTEMAMDFLNNKGIKNTSVVGVGLDTTSFSYSNITSKKYDFILNEQFLLYVGTISKRKNVEFLFKVFNILKSIPQNKNIKLLLIGKSEGDYLEKCMKTYNSEVASSVIHLNHVNNSELSFFYENALLFLLPSKQEIFGMVLLEAMYFRVPVIASATAGAKTLIEPGYNGYIIESFDEKKWVDEISKILINDELKKRLSDNASKTITDNFLWNNIVEKFIAEFNIN